MKQFGWFLLFFIGCVYPVFARELDQSHTHIRLVSEQNAVVAGTTFWVGLDFILDDGWHLYWQNPGDSGLAPKIKWQLPTGLKAGDISWPYPQHLNVGPLTSYGYEHKVILLVPINVDKNFLNSKNLDLDAKVNWLACQDICIPGHAQVDLNVPVVADQSLVTLNANKESFDQTRRDLPQILTYISAHATLNVKQWQLFIKSPYKTHQDILFYPFRDDVIEHPAPQVTQLTSDGYELTLTKSHIYQGPMTSLEGIVVNPGGWDAQGKIKAIIIKAPVELAAPVVSSPIIKISFLMACVFSLVGGLLLNLMPCVLPVLSIKVLHLVERHPDRRIALIHSFVYALGILFSVWALAGLLFVLKSLGHFAGWGFQFQSPIFVIVVAFILLVLALNLFGLFEFSMPAIGIRPTQRLGLQASFISGVITTIVASPCTAPFMGTALTLAISQPDIIGFGIFTSLGLGLAMPFIILSAFPAFLSFVPRPGPWMIHLKQVLGLVLLACVVWLVWVFGLETGLGDIFKFYKPAHQIQWQAYSSTAVTQARQSGHGVFLDFTAAWCINCQVNDRLVLQNRDVVKAFKDQAIIAFKADWTKYDPAITQALASLGRDSIPVYVYYPPRSDALLLLPQVITPGIILKEIKNYE